MLALKDKSRLQDMIGKTWMYRSNIYTFNDLVESNGHVILSTTRKAITIPAEKVAAFIDECLPTEAPIESRVARIDIEPGIITDLTTGLMKSFAEIDKAENPDTLKIALLRAKAKTNVSNSVTMLANMVLKAKKVQ